MTKRSWYEWFDKMADKAKERYKRFYREEYGTEYNDRCHNDACDAFKHAYTAAEVTNLFGNSDFGKQVMRLLGHSVEVAGQFQNAYSPFFGAKSKSQEQMDKEHNMDLGNNDIGADSLLGKQSAAFTA
jgi:hypothetical protein